MNPQHITSADRSAQKPTTETPGTGPYTTQSLSLRARIATSYLRLSILRHALITVSNPSEPSTDIIRQRAQEAPIPVRNLWKVHERGASEGLKKAIKAMEEYGEGADLESAGPEAVRKMVADAEDAIRILGSVRRELESEEEDERGTEVKVQENSRWERKKVKEIWERVEDGTFVKQPLHPVGKTNWPCGFCGMECFCERLKEGKRYAGRFEE